MRPKTVYLETMGCQMNVLDSELVMGRLRACGYHPIDDMAEADVVLINTCSVRDHAEQKALSHLGSLRRPKEARPEMVLGVIGCMAERDPDGILDKMRHVDLVCGPGELYKLPALIEEVQASRKRAIALSGSMSRKSTPLQRALEYDSVEALDTSREPAPGQSVLQPYVRVQRGCDKFCTFCVVPFTRGPERSRPPSQIVDEAKMLVDHGAREVTLLGQTVNSYVHQENGRTVRFAELLAKVNDIPGLDRVRFVTSYPGDFSDDIFDAMSELPKVCEYLHLPVQSGSDAVLARMRRQYTVAHYLDLIDRARNRVPGVTIASDFIVGFCGETQEDHRASVALIERCRFKNIFVFKYSPRPGTVADKSSADGVDDAVKRRRNGELLELQERISAAANQRMIGRTVEVLIEGYSKAALKAQEAEQTRGETEPRALARAISTEPRARQSRIAAARPVSGEVSLPRSDQLVGRTGGDRIVVFPGRPEHIGRFARIRITAATALTLHGIRLEASKCECEFRPTGNSPLPVIGSA